MMADESRQTAMPGRPTGRPWHVRLLGLVADVRPGEGQSALLFSGHAFLLLVCYYLLKTLREPLLLTGGSAEMKSYAYAVVALVLLVLVPVYGVVCRRVDRGRLTHGVTVFFLLNLAVFCCLGRAGVDVGFAYYVWVGVFGVAVLAQFWAHAADTFNVAGGQRQFPLIMAGAAMGALVGPGLARVLFPLLGPWDLMLVAMALLASTLPLVGWAREAVPGGSRNRAMSPPRSGRVGPAAGEAQRTGPFGGFGLVLRDRYLMLLALLVVLLNCINSTGEFMLTDFVLRFADEQVAAQPGLDRGELIAAFYGEFFFVVNTLSLIVQVFLVGRVVSWIGIHGALLIVPVIAFIGYGLAAFVPIFAIIRLVKIVENSADYSLMNTARQALYLPLPTAEKYEGKAAIDTFFWRFGDLVQAGVIFAGLHWLGFGFQEFAMLNMVLAGVWIVVASEIGRCYSRRAAGVGQPAEQGPRLSLARGLEVPGIDAAFTIGRARGFGLTFWRGRGIASTLLVLLLGVATVSVPTATKAEIPDSLAEQGLFSSHEPLGMEFHMDMRALCRDPNRKGCEDVPATLIYRDDGGREHRVEALVRSRGRYRRETGNCTLPALFVSLPGPTTGTLFEGETMLPLTTHCRNGNREYEQYVLKEYLAYRIYNLLTAKSLRVRLIQVTYRDTGRPRSNLLTRYGFFIEHFDSLAARHDAEVWKPERFDLATADPMDLGIHDLFQYMIGNTDWSVVFGHNIVHIRNRDSLATPVPYDFDFSGLVNARYATTDPSLPISRVEQRLFRGFCLPGTEWKKMFTEFDHKTDVVLSLPDQALLDPPHRQMAGSYLNAFFDDLGRKEITKNCRPPPNDRPTDQ